MGNFFVAIPKAEDVWVNEGQVQSVQQSKKVSYKVAKRWEQLRVLRQRYYDIWHSWGDTSNPSINYGYAEQINDVEKAMEKLIPGSLGAKTYGRARVGYPWRIFFVSKPHFEIKYPLLPPDDVIETWRKEET